MQNCPKQEMMNSKRNVTDSRRMGPAGEPGIHTNVSDVASRAPQGDCFCTWDCCSLGIARGLCIQHSSKRSWQGLHSSSGKSPPGPGVLNQQCLKQPTARNSPQTTQNYCHSSVILRQPSLLLNRLCSDLPGVPGHV